MLFRNRYFSGIYWTTLLLFIANKVAIRPYVLVHNFPETIQVFVLSFPNLCEAIVGSFVLLNFAMYINSKHITAAHKWSEKKIYIAVFTFAALFVITQELKIHNLGGRNVYDPNDLVFSIIGLILSFALLMYIRPQLIKMNTYVG